MFPIISKHKLQVFLCLIRLAWCPESESTRTPRTANVFLVFVATTYLLDLGADQVTSRDMSVAELFDELLALGAFATTWGSSNEGDFGVA